MSDKNTIDETALPPVAGSLAARCSRCLSTATTCFFKRQKIGKKGKEILLCNICADVSRKTLIGGHGFDWQTISPANVSDVPCADARPLNRD